MYTYYQKTQHWLVKKRSRSIPSRAYLDDFDGISTELADHVGPFVFRNDDAQLTDGVLVEKLLHIALQNLKHTNI